MSSKTPEAKEKIQKLQEAGYELVPPNDARSDSESETAVRISVDGESDRELAQLLEDTAKFIRAMGDLGDAQHVAHIEMMFKRVDLGEFVIVSHRS